VQVFATVAYIRHFFLPGSLAHITGQEFFVGGIFPFLYSGILRGCMDYILGRGVLYFRCPFGGTGDGGSVSSLGVYVAFFGFGFSFPSFFPFGGRVWFGFTFHGAL
jgi:hypothetical protein